jgi:DMSO/TMAO reductase YedYZ heme-binding membrane subunit
MPASAPFATLPPLTPRVANAATLTTLPGRPGPAQVRKAIGPVYRGLPKPVRFVGWVVIALIFGAVLGTTAPSALRRLGAVAALQPGLLAWYSVRALGFLAYLVVAASVLYGLLLSTKILDAIAHRPVSFALHKDLALVGMLLATLHVVILLADQSFAFTPRALLVPFASPYSPTWVGIGQITFYGLAIITASFYVRRQIGQRAWRMLHYLTFLAFIGATVHGIMSGSDSGSFWAFWVYLVPGATSVFLLTYRITISMAARVSRSEVEPSAASATPTRMALLFPGGRVPSDRRESSYESDLA